MKKLILISSLLAATTLAANAATLLEADFTTMTLLPTGWTATNNLGDSGNFSEDNGLKSTSWGFPIASCDLSESINLGADGEYAFKFETKYSDLNSQTAFVVAGSDFSLVVGSAYNEPAGIHAGKVDADALGSTKYNFKADGTNGVTGITAKTTVYSSSAPLNVWLTYDMKLTTRANGNDILSVSIYQAGTEGAIATASYSFDSSSILTKGGFTMDAALANAYVKNISIKAVPEPSAFGLLAGLGALALVGARRRRRK